MDSTNSDQSHQKAKKPFRPVHHFFWIESAFLASVFKGFLSKSAWAAYVLLCRRCSPMRFADGLDHAVAFSGINDLSQVLGFPRPAAEKALDELAAKHFIRRDPTLPPPVGRHFLKGAGIEVLLLPPFDLTAKTSFPWSAPRVIPNIFEGYLAMANRPIYVPSKLCDEGKLKRLIRSWDMMRLMFHLYDVQEHADFGAVPHGLVLAEAEFEEQDAPEKIEAGEVGNPALIGKEIKWVVDFDAEGYDDPQRYRLSPDLYRPLGIAEADAVKSLISLKAEGLIRWKCLVLQIDPEDTALISGSYENTAGQYRWLEKEEGLIPFIPDYLATGTDERVIFVVTTFLHPLTGRTLAYRAARRKASEKFRGWAEESGEEADG